MFIVDAAIKSIAGSGVIKITPDVIQVSEQWSGGLTLFSNI